MHAANGLYFDRAGDGSVVVTVKASDAENAVTLRDVTIDAKRWAEVIEEMVPPEVVSARLSEDEAETSDEIESGLDEGEVEAVEDDDDDDGGLDVTPPASRKPAKKK